MDLSYQNYSNVQSGLNDRIWNFRKCYKELFKLILRHLKYYFEQSFDT